MRLSIRPAPANYAEAGDVGRPQIVHFPTSGPESSALSQLFSDYPTLGIQSMTITKRNYILIDYENVQAMALERLESLPVSVVIFVGQNQQSIPIELFRKACAFTGSIEVIESVAIGKNALDFQIACYAGAVGEKEPSAFIHFVTKDKGFDAVVLYLKSLGRLAARSDSFLDLGLFASKDEFKKSSIEQRHEHAIAKIAKFPTNSRPRKVKTLLSSMNAFFGKQLDDAELKEVLDSLVSRGLISVGTSESISYNIPESQKR